MNTQISIAILAGGKSSRMGEDKARMIVNGKACIRHIMEAASPLTKDLFIVAGRNNSYGDLGLPVYTDVIPDKGPAGGILTALKAARNSRVLVLACDTPFVDKSLLQFLIINSLPGRLSVICHEEQIEPLFAIYDKKFTGELEEWISKGIVKLHTIFENLDPVKVPVNGERFSSEKFSNLNTPEDRLKI